MEDLITKSLEESTFPISHKKTEEKTHKFLTEYITTALSIRGDNYYNEEIDKANQQTYYQNLSPTPDYNQLNQLLASTYHKAKRRINLWANVDRRPDGTLMCAYSNARIETADFRRGYQANEEHLIPQSWHQGSELHPEEDMHQIFVVIKEANSSRGNRIFGYSRGKFIIKTGGIYMGSNYFKPHFNRGAVCRAILYTLVAYKETFLKNHFPPSSLKWIIQTARDEPISLWEKHRNQELHKLQGNRNPFIDHPEWCDKINYMGGYFD